MLSKFSNQELQEELERRKKEQLLNPVGFWKVSTDRDVEGKSTTQLGIHHGHLAEVALRLSGSAMYSLYIERLEEEENEPLPSPRNEVSVCYSNIVSGYSQDSAAEAIQKMIGSEYKVSASRYYRSVLIRKKEML